LTNKQQLKKRYSARLINGPPHQLAKFELLTIFLIILEFLDYEN